MGVIARELIAIVCFRDDPDIARPSLTQPALEITTISPIATKTTQDHLDNVKSLM